MPTNIIRPIDLAGIKRLAKTIKRERGISHAQALDAAAQAGGFENLRHAQNVLTAGSHAAQPAAAAAKQHAPSTDSPMPAAASPPAPPRRSFNSTYAEHLRERIRTTEDQLKALRNGRITGLGYGPGPSDPGSVALETLRLERQLEEDQALVFMDRAKERLTVAERTVFKDLLPHGNGMPTFEAVAELDKANEEFKRAKSKMDQLAHQIRASRR